MRACRQPDQDLALQLDALEAAGCVRVFSETASGAHSQRPQLERLFDQLREGDTLVVWRLDRLGRSLRHLVTIVEELGARGVSFRALDQQIDTTTDSGRPWDTAAGSEPTGRLSSRRSWCSCLCRRKRRSRRHWLGHGPPCSLFGAPTRPAVRIIGRSLGKQGRPCTARWR